MAKQTATETRFSANELIDLIRESGKAGVAALVITSERLEVHFGGTQTPAQAPQSLPEQEKERLAIQEKLFAEEEQRARQDEVEHMAIENPTRFEELTAAGELEDEINGDNEQEA